MVNIAADSELFFPTGPTHLRPDCVGVGRVRVIHLTWRAEWQKLYAFVVASLVLTLSPVTSVGQTSDEPETVVVHNGPVALHAMVWRPQGSGPFPAILLNHGSGRSREQLERLGSYERNAEILGPVFSRHGYVFLYLFRHGVGPSSDQGANAFDLMNKESAEHELEARNTLQL